MIKVLHIITGLSTGGAEMMLYNLLSRIDRTAFDPQVISLTNIGSIGGKIRALGVPVRAMGMRRSMPNPLEVLRLAYQLRKARPDVIQTWMYHADLVGGLAAKIARDIPLAWGIRASNLDPQGIKRRTIWTVMVCARLSRWLPTRIVCCSVASQRVHTERGYSTDKMVVIPNGFDLDAFRPDPGARLTVRQELGISKEALLIGLVARFDPLKDHRNFVQAAALLHARVPDVHFLLCGDGITWENRDLAGLIDAAGIRNCCHLLGLRDDVPRLLATLDIASLSSYGEGLPNVVGEAMACGVPCVVTDVGDSALIVAETGRVVPPKDWEALAAAWREMIEIGAEERKQLGLAARRRIEEHFSLAAVVERYQELYTWIVRRSSQNNV